MPASSSSRPLPTRPTLSPCRCGPPACASKFLRLGLSRPTVLARTAPGVLQLAVRDQVLPRVRRADSRPVDRRARRGSPRRRRLLDRRCVGGHRRSRRHAGALLTVSGTHSQGRTLSRTAASCTTRARCTTDRASSSPSTARSEWAREGPWPALATRTDHVRARPSGLVHLGSSIRDRSTCSTLTCPARFGSRRARC